MKTNGVLKVTVSNCINVPNLERLASIDPYVYLVFQGIIIFYLVTEMSFKYIVEKI
jgi:hypothetical protein